MLSRFTLYPLNFTARILYTSTRQARELNSVSFHKIHKNTEDHNACAPQGGKYQQCQSAVILLLSLQVERMILAGAVPMVKLSSLCVSQGLEQSFV